MKSSFGAPVGEKVEPRAQVLVQCRRGRRPRRLHVPMTALSSKQGWQPRKMLMRCESGCQCLVMTRSSSLVLLRCGTTEYWRPRRLRIMMPIQLCRMPMPSCAIWLAHCAKPGPLAFLFFGLLIFARVGCV